MENITRFLDNFGIAGLLALVFVTGIIFTAGVMIMLWLPRFLRSCFKRKVRLPLALSELQYVLPKRPPPPPDMRPKLFLSLAAVIATLRRKEFQYEDLDRCLFCISHAQIALLREYASWQLDSIQEALAKAASEGRLLAGNGLRYLHATTYAEVNAFLVRNGKSPLFIAKGAESTRLDNIPQLACVPRLEDDSMEVIWVEQHLPDGWQNCFGAEEHELEAEAAAMPDDDSDPYAPPVWLNPANDRIRAHADLRQELWERRNPGDAGGDDHPPEDE